MKSKLTSRKLQDIEAIIEIIKKKGNTLKTIYKIGIIPYLPIRHNVNKKQWIKILEFEKKQEKERLVFWDRIFKR
jgi:hypothetical protein